MGPRIHLPLYHRRSHWHCPSQLLPRRSPSRHLLRSGPLPLRSINRRRLRPLCCVYPLIPPNKRNNPAHALKESSLRTNIYWRQPNVLPTTLPRPQRHAPTLLRLPRRPHQMKYCLLNRVHNLIRCPPPIHLHSLRKTYFSATSNRLLSPTIIYGMTRHPTSRIS